MKDVHVLGKKHLPKKEEFFNDLTCQHISQEEYTFAQKVWDSFSCKIFQDYMEIYLLADCLLLCDVFENFRTNCLGQYNIDPCYYFSAPHFTFDAFLRHNNLTLEVLSDVNQYLFIVTGIRGCQWFLRRSVLTVLGHALLNHIHWLALCIYMLVRYVNQEIQRFIPVSYTHLTLPTIYSV